ncbi:MAG: ferrous iron transport protein B, partial [Pseudomonadales bacterium]|nr:ferrous iron transport protein B [Pseudomonadales bacterium]
GTRVDAEALARQLGVPVAPIIASRGRGVEELTMRVGELVFGGSEGFGKAVVSPTRAPAAASASDALVQRYYRARELLDGVVEYAPVKHTLTEQIDRWVLNRYLGIPVFLLMMYLMFTIAVNFGAVFIDFFDILFGAIFVDGTRWVMSSVSMPEWLIVLVSDGLGGGIQLVATFIPVIGFLFLCLSLLEDSGYMSRAAFVVDRLMARIGLPGTAFVPLIVGFGCNVPAVMASRSLGRESDRLMTISMAPFMSCGARLTVYALFASAMFPSNGSNVVFLLYLLGIAMAVGTGYVFRKQIFTREVTPSFQEMPAYHIPVPRNILLTTWFRLRSFVFRAGKTIVGVVVILSFLNSFSFDGTFGHQDTGSSALATIGKEITPAFAPIGLHEDNWPATVGLFTGVFAKEAVVGTLDALYSGPGEPKGDGAPDIGGAAIAALVSIVDNAAGLADLLLDPLGVSAIHGDEDVGAAAAEQGVATSTLTNMAAAFGTQFAAYCYLVFVLLYATCVAVMGTIAKEAGWKWMVLVVFWTTSLAYVTASVIYQAGTLPSHPLFSSLWIAGSLVFMAVFIHQLRTIGRRALPGDLIRVVQIG